MILLDTNVLSALMQERPDQEVIRWLDQQPRTSIWTTSITVFEIQFEIQVMASGKRRASLTGAFDRLLSGVLEQRVAPFEASAAERTAHLMATRRKRGDSVDLRDTMIAGITLAAHATLATRNTKHFQDIAAFVVNPWER